MAAVIESWFRQDLQKPVQVHYLDGSLFSNNGNGNRIGVELTNGGEDYTVTGTVSGYAVLADGSTVPCTGAKSGNKASILVPPAAYLPGNIFITIFLTDGTTVTTLAAVSSTVIQARTDNQVSPGSVVTDWTNTINAAMQSVETAAANLGQIVATPYAQLTFPVPLGKYTYYNNNLYRCTTPIATSEDFTAAHWSSALNLGDEVSDLKSAFNWVAQGKNLCGMKTDVLYPVPNIKDMYITMSTSNGSNMTNNYFYLYCYGKDKQQLSGNRGYYKFVAGNSSYTHHTYSDQDIYFVKWSAEYAVPLQVEIGQEVTAYEPYWGNALYLNGLEPRVETLESGLSDLSESFEKIDDLIGNAGGDYNLVNIINDNKYLNKGNCIIYDADAYRTSDPISIEEETSYIVGLFNEKNAPTHECNAITVCFYDSSTNGMPNYSVYSSDFTHDNCSWENGFVKFTSPSGAKTLRIGANDSAAPFKWFLTKTSNPNLYASSDEIKQSKISENDDLQGTIIAVFGDSIMGNTRDRTSTPSFISEATGATVLNFGFGGCRMSVHTGDWDKCSMYQLADDIYNESFTDLVSAITTGWSGMPGYFRDTAAWLASCDFSKVDAILIAYGSNDYRETSSILDNPSDKFDTSTVCGALRYSIKQILSKYPKIQILVTCPIFRTFFQEGTTIPDEYSDTKDWGSGTLLQYAEAYKQACADMNVPFLDLYHETSFNPYTRLYFYPADDGTHPNEKGRERIGKIIGGRLIELMPSY